MHSLGLLALALAGHALATVTGEDVSMNAMVGKRGNGNPSPDPIQIKAISAAGTGCPAGSYAQNIATDQTAFTLTFSQFAASIGPSVPASKNQLGCEVKLDLHNPGGVQYSILSVNYRGFIDIGASVSATLKNSYCFSQHNTQKKTSHAFAGPQAADYVRTDEVPYKSIVWSPCGKDTTLKIHTTLGLKSSDPSQQGVVVLDSMDGEFVQKYHIAWRPCKTT